MSVGSPNSLKSPTETKLLSDSTMVNGQKSKLNGDIEEPIPAQRKSKSMMKKLVGGVAVLPTLNNRTINKEDDRDQKENLKKSPVIYDYEPGRRTTMPEQVKKINNDLKLDFLFIDYNVYYCIF